MKSTDSQEQYKELFYTDNTLIIDALTDDVRAIILEYMRKLDATDKTVVTTDPYLLGTNSTQYRALITSIFTQLQAKEVIFVTKQRVARAREAVLRQTLQGLNCAYSRRVPTREHDRFWICLENGKGITTGASMNGIEKTYSRISELDSEEVQRLVQILTQERALSAT